MAELGQHQGAGEGLAAHHVVAVAFVGGAGFEPGGQTIAQARHQLAFGRFGDDFGVHQQQLGVAVVEAKAGDAAFI